MFGFPLLLIPLAIYNIIAFLMSDVKFDAQLIDVSLRSGDTWTVQLGHALVALALLLLVLELLRSARAGGKYFTDHLLALLIFGGAAAEFVLLPKFGNSTFFLLTLIALVDFLSGLGLRAPRSRRVRETVVADPVREPLPERESPIPPAPLSGTLASEQMPLPPGERIAPRMVVPPRVEPIVEARPPDESEPFVGPPAPRT